MWQPETNPKRRPFISMHAGSYQVHRFLYQLLRKKDTLFFDAKYYKFRNKQWTMKGSLDFVFMNQIKQINSRKHEFRYRNI